MCDLCCNWYHAKCEKVEDNIYKAINSKEGQISLYWVCSSCLKPSRGIMKKMAELVQKLNQYEDRLQTLENKENDEEAVKTYATAAAKEYLQENPVQGVDQEELKRTLKAEVTQDLDARDWPGLDNAANIPLKNRFQALVEEKLDEREKEKNDEIHEEEKRKNNLVVYGVKESEDTDKDNRKKHDKDEIIKISKFLGLDDFTEYNIVRILRMGTYTEGTRRPLLVELDSAVTKYKIMRNTYKLKDVDDYKGWSLQHDMTKEQRENVKKLVEEAKLKTAADESGEYIYRVRGPPHKKFIKRIKKD